MRFNLILAVVSVYLASVSLALPVSEVQSVELSGLSRRSETNTSLSKVKRQGTQGQAGATGGLVGGLANGVGGAVGAIGTAVGGAVGAIGSAVGGTVGAVGSAVGGAVDGAVGAVGAATGGAGQTAP
ncbi:hypothetical protein EC973_008399 [Apophysomyces ossiformis]|uniref:Uncharacterized protein n=1 Tax=Apophysomyces ossiformis TaxID=679940 RepID=A0A8H7BNE5_9FUNG|nr:hypothetical protein EC973_008399 [Apophysomyces ossiformis]